MNAPEDTPKTSTAPVQGKHFSTGAYVLAGIAGVFTGIVILPLAMWGVDVLDHDYFGYYDRCHPQGDKGIVLDWTNIIVVIFFSFLSACGAVVCVMKRLFQGKNYADNSADAQMETALVTPWNVYFFIPIFAFLLLYPFFPQDSRPPVSPGDTFPITGWRAPVREC